jgi:Arc/MetJ-type ribon-helix-helix transcriptional regulator
MSKQITVRLPDEIVEFIDRLVDGHQASSRASVVARVMERERRRDLAARDAAILAEHGDYPDLEGLSSYAGGTTLSDLD